MKPKYVERQIMLHGYRQLCSLHKKEHIHVEIAKDNEKSFDISKHELERQFSWGEHKNFIGLMKDELGGKIMRVCCTETKNIQLFNRWRQWK